MTELSALTIASIGVAVASVIGAFFAGIVTIITAVRATAKKVDSIETKADVIKVSVDGAATKSAEQITALLQKIEFMEKSAAEERQKAAILANAASIALAVHPGSPVVVNGSTVAASPPAEASLRKIDENTKETAENTKPTGAEAAVKKET